MIMKIASGIIADHPTVNGNIYTREALEKAIRDFNMRAKNNPVKGSILDRVNIQKVGDVTHEVNELFLNESGMLCAEINVLDSNLKQRITDKTSIGCSIAARPVISIPTFIADRQPVMVTQIKDIIRVHIEVENESEGSKDQDKGGREQ